MRKKIFLLLLMLIPFVGVQAQIIKKSNKDKIGQNIKNGFNNFMNTIEQDAHPTGEHNLWEGYVGPKLGIGVSSMPGAGGAPEPGAIAGGFFEVFFAKNLSFMFELDFQHQGGNNIHYAALQDVHDAEGNVTGQVVNSGKYNYNLNYINTSYLLRWYPWPYRPISVYTGLQLARLISAHSHLKGGDDSDIKDELFKGEFDIPVGASYEWKQWQFDVRYFISPRKLSRTHRAKQILGNARNQMLSFSVAYRIQIF